MKTMSCKQLGGACAVEFHGNTFDEMAEQSRQHAMEMLAQKDPDHLNAMAEMTELMKQPEAMQQWFADKKKEFEDLPDD